MPAAVERIIHGIEKSKTLSGMSDPKEKYGHAIAIAKASGQLRQKGKHLALGRGQKED